MNEASLPAALAAAWLGVLTSVSPCPLATNIAAVGFIGRHAASPVRVMAAGLAYTLGRAIAYAALAALIVAGLLAIPAVSHFLQRYLNQVLGPLLVLVGMVLLGLLRLRASSSVGGQGLRERAGRGGILGAALLGVLFALSFCPVSAALYFGSLIPLAVSAGSPLVLPGLYGVGTGLPVVIVAVLVATGSQRIGALAARAETFDVWARRITGTILIIVGTYLTLRYVFLG